MQVLTTNLGLGTIWTRPFLFLIVVLSAYSFHKLIFHFFVVYFLGLSLKIKCCLLFFPISWIQAPSSETQDKILFMINNISLSNMDTKAKEFSEVLKEHYYPWFAQYMVMKR